MTVGPMLGAVAFAHLFLAQIVLQEKARPTPGEWSARGVYLGYGLGVFDYPGKLRVQRVPAPDKHHAVLFEGYYVFVSSNGDRLAGKKEWFFSTLSEILWSPDSSAFAITRSDGGWVGSWDVEVFFFPAGGLKKTDVSAQAKRDAQSLYKCGSSDEPGNEEPNIGAVQWIAGSSELLIVAEVPPHSSCPEMGKLFGYIVSVPSGKIIRRFDEQQLKASWGSLFGERLRHR